MMYIIDAWLECTHPQLRLLDKVTGEVCLIVFKKQLEYLQEQGDLDVNRLYSIDPIVIQEVSNDLLEAISY